MKLYKLINHITQLYISILLSKKNIKILKLYKQNLKTKQKNIKTNIQNKTTLKNNLNKIISKILKTNQQFIKNHKSLTNTLKLLNYYTKKNINKNTSLSIKPINKNNSSSKIQHPKLKLINLQHKILQKHFKLTNHFTLPQISLYTNTNYNQPNPNFLNQNLHS